MTNSVATAVGDCRIDEPRTDPDEPRSFEPPECTTLIQMPSPSVSAPPELDLAQLGRIYLQVLGMTEEEAELYAGSVNWATTFVLPVPQGDADYKEVTVDGVAGTFVQDRYNYPRSYTLMWIKDGMVYLLIGPGTEADALAMAASLR